MATIKYIGAGGRKQNGPRWRALLDAALEQPSPSPALIAAIHGLEHRGRNDRMSANERYFHNSLLGRLMNGTDINPNRLKATNGTRG